MLNIALRVLVFALVTVSALPPALAAPTSERRLLTAEDINAVREVSDPQLSPDGQWVAYVVSEADRAKDKQRSHVWMASWDGKQQVQLTYSEDSEHTPRFSPDGKYVAFLTARGEDEPPEQVWLLDRAGGEAKPLSGFNGDVVDFQWSPDSKKLALIVSDEDPRKQRGADKDKTPPPRVIDRFYFKEDVTGYLGTQRQHLYVMDLATRKAENLTPGRFNESMPSWSPDGSRIAFFSNRNEDPDRSNEFGLYTVEPRAGAQPQLVTRFIGDAGDSSWMSMPAWRPDGRELAIVVSRNAKLIYYAVHHLAVVSAAGGTPRLLGQELDRNIMEPQWSADGRSIYFLLEDNRNQVLARIGAAGGNVERLLEGRRATNEFDVGPKGRIAVLESNVASPDTIYALEGKQVRALSHHNDEWLGSVKLGSTEEISFSSKDGTRINGLLVKPPGYTPGRRYPTILSIHGGPVAQYSNSFMTPWQIFAAQGYVVVGVNPRGSSGRGEAFATAITADWGGKDSEDVLAAIDYAIQQGIADPDRLGVSGWSYGGILTNVVIAKDTRFKSATSGASISNVLAGYGTDMYIREYELELGVPWKNLDVYLHNSYAFLHADRIKTPTLFLCGEQDFNVPLLNSEQMYQALRSLNVPTQLIIYPGENHGIRKPSYLQDRMQRYLDWHGKYLQPTPSTSPPPSAG